MGAIIVSTAQARGKSNVIITHTVDVNIDVLGTYRWHTRVWQVLFVLLDTVELASLRVKAMQQYHEIDLRGMSSSLA